MAKDRFRRCDCGDPECPSCGTAQGTYVPPKYKKRKGAWKYNYSHKPTTLQALELAAAFVGMYTTGGVPQEYVGQFDRLLEDPEWALHVIMGAIEKEKTELGGMPMLTLGQLIYTLVMSNTNGIDPEALISRVQEEGSKLLLARETILNKTVLLQSHGYIRQDSGRWYAPGPKPLIWEAL